MKEIFKNKKGFTLIELLVVISIIGILTIISASSFRNAQIKSRDAQRKSDLSGLSKALMMYYNDNGRFPSENVVEFGNVEVGLTGTNEIVYMRKIPEDPENISPYKYVYKVNTTDFKEFNLFSNLENTNDSQCQETPYLVDGEEYCYGVSSPNTIVKNW